MDSKYPGVTSIRRKLLTAFFKRHHYSRTCHGGIFGYALVVDGEIVGAVGISTPSSEKVRASVFGDDHKSRVLEIHRLCLINDIPKSWTLRLLSGSIKKLHADRPALWALITYADSSEGHHGGIYQAASFLFVGVSPGRFFYRDNTGLLRHPRISGRNINRSEAHKRGWTVEKRGDKFRYLKILKRCPSAVRDRLKLNASKYPKPDYKTNQPSLFKWSY